METIIKKRIPRKLKNWKGKLLSAFAFCLVSFFVLSIFLVVGWKYGSWPMPVFLVNLNEYAFFIFTAILTLFRLQLVFPTVIELSLDQLFENLKNFL